MTWNIFHMCIYKNYDGTGYCKRRKWKLSCSIYFAINQIFIKQYTKKYTLLFVKFTDNFYQILFFNDHTKITNLQFWISQIFCHSSCSKCSYHCIGMLTCFSNSKPHYFWWCSNNFIYSKHYEQIIKCCTMLACIITLVTLDSSKISILDTIK